MCTMLAKHGNQRPSEKKHFGLESPYAEPFRGCNSLSERLTPYENAWEERREGVSLNQPIDTRSGDDKARAAFRTSGFCFPLRFQELISFHSCTYIPLFLPSA